MHYLGGAALLLAVFLGANVWQSFTSPPPAQTLPDLSLTTLDGSTEQLETQNVPTVVYLWATDCGACTGDFSLLADAARSARYGGFRYLFVNQGNDEASVRRYLEANGLTDVAESVYLDPANRVYDALEAFSLPASYFFWGAAVCTRRGQSSPARTGSSTRWSRFSADPEIS